MFRRLWHWLGVADDVWGRLRILWLLLLAIGGALVLLGFLNTALLVLGLVGLLVGGGGLLIDHVKKNFGSEEGTSLDAHGTGNGGVSGSSFDFYFEIEAQDGAIDVNRRLFTRNVYVWLIVRNNGATAEFSARALNITGVPATWGNPYVLRQVVWEGSASPRAEIDGYGGERRLDLANVAREPRAFWFNTTQLGAPMAGNQDLLFERVSPYSDHEYRFDLEVVNLDTGEVQGRAARILLPASGDLPVCELMAGNGAYL